MWYKIKQTIKAMKEKKGISSLTMVAGVMIAFVAIGGLADLTVLQTKMSALSTQTGYVSRVVSGQGGISTNRIDNYHGRYVTSQELYSNIQSAMNNAGIDEDNWTVTIGGSELTPATHIDTLNYGDRLPVSVTIGYNWPFTSNFVPSAMENSRTSQTEVVTTHRIRDGGYSE